MRNEQRIWRRRREAGIALLISIFILLLISVVAIAVIVSSGTESALTGNYRSSTAVYYAALAGVEDARARLRANDPNAFRKLRAGTFLPDPGTDLTACSPVYIVNPAAGEVVTPWDSSNPYYDSQYNLEFGATGVCPAGPWPPSPSPNTSSLWNINPLPFPAPAYKWVRINSITEQLLQLDVAPYDGTPSENKLIYYDGTRLTDTQIPGSQVLEITALAVLPNGSQKLLQYLVAPIPLSLIFPSALTLDGNNPQFTASTSPSFWVKGTDQGSVGSCNPGAAHDAVGYTDNSFTVANFERPTNPLGIKAGPSPSPDLRGNYIGVASTPDVSLVSLSSTLGCPGCSLTTVGGLNALVNAITEDADVVINGNATQTGSSGPLPSTMSATNPMTIVINGDFTLSGWRNTGYGLLLVTGEFTYDPDGQWDGIILVIGKGWMRSSQAAYITTQIQGAVLLARTVDASGNPLPSSSVPVFTPPSSGSPTSGFDFSQTPNTLTNGIYYSNCWIQASQPTSGYKILSFHEISQ